MTKITLNISKEQLEVLNKCFITYSKEDEITGTKDFRSLINIARLLRKRFKKKAIDKEFSSDTFKLHFEYFEAYTLERIIIMKIEEFASQIYEYTFLLGVISKLDKQLQS